MRDLRSGPRSIEGRPVRMRRWQTAVFAGVAMAAGLLAMAPFAGLIALARDDTGDQPLHRRISASRTHRSNSGCLAARGARADEADAADWHADIPQKFPVMTYVAPTFLSRARPHDSTSGTNGHGLAH